MRGITRTFAYLVRNPLAVGVGLSIGVLGTVITIATLTLCGVRTGPEQFRIRIRIRMSDPWPPTMLHFEIVSTVRGSDPSVFEDAKAIIGKLPVSQQAIYTDENIRAYWTTDRVDARISVPVIVLLGLTLPLPIIWLRRRSVLASRWKAGLCLMCGYDIRGISGRCPECGAGLHCKTRAHEENKLPS